jgi:N-acetylneuraminic acid mutarotase
MKRNIFLFAFLLALTGLYAQEWESVAGLPQGAADARHHPVTFSIDGYGYLLTGSVNGQATKDFMRYDPSSDSWETLPDFPGPSRSFSYGTARGNKAYMGFGGNSSAVLKDLWEYDATTEEWTQLADCPCAPRFHPAFIQTDDKIYVGLGNNSVNLRDWWEYDIATDTWVQHDDLPSFARHHPFYFAIDNVPYVGFGHGNIGLPEVYKDFYKFDPATEEWIRLEDFPGEGRVAGTQFDYNGKGYILSGDGDNHSFMATGEFWEYDAELDEWTQLPPHPGSSRWAPGNFVIDNYVYFMCGESNIQMESDMMRFELDPLVSSTTNAFVATPILIAPNPATTEISFVEDVAQFSEVRVLNSLGQVMTRGLSNTIDVSAFPNGTYYLQFFKEKSMRTEKFVIVR